jgi:hypothetical protein
MKDTLVTTSIRIPQELLNKLQTLADLNPRVNSRNDLIKNILFDYVEGK